MQYEFYREEDNGPLHIDKHDVTPVDISEFFEEIKSFKYQRRDGAWVAIGRLKNGRNLEVIYRLFPEDSVYIITAYDIEDKQTLHYLKDALEDYYGKNF